MTPSPTADIVHIHFDPTIDGLNVVDDLTTVVAWLPILGPTATWLIYLTASWANRDRTTSYPTDALAVALGIGRPALTKTFDRLVQFRIATWASTDTLVIGSPLPPVSAHQRARIHAAASGATR